MRVALLGAVALASTMMLVNTVEASGNCGPGFYYNGYRCVAKRVAPPPPPRYVPPPARYIPPPPPPRYAPRGWRPAFIDSRGQQLFYPRPGGACPRGYTVQAGYCRPYRGY